MSCVRRPTFFSVAFCFLFAACSGGSSSSSSVDGGAKDIQSDVSLGDVKADGGADVETVAGVDTTTGKDGGDTSSSSQDTAAQEEIGTECETDEDCPNGLCVEAEDTKVCAASCDGGCPIGWSCKTEGDSSFCVPA